MADKVEVKLKGHETFTLREGWLHKGLLCVKDGNNPFSKIKGADKLGVGSNMVGAVRYWMRAFNLIEESQKEGTMLSALGMIIADNDIFLEDVFTLWLLHSNIAKNKKYSIIWYLFFNKCEAQEFKKDDLFCLLKNELFKYIGHYNSKENLIQSDIDVLLNMYSKNRNNDDPEDKNNCPLAVLGLLKKEQDTYIKQQPDLRKINEWVILYELSCMFMEEKSLSIEKIAEEIGNIYHMTRVTVNGFLDTLDNMEYIKVDRTAGSDIVYPIHMLQPIEVINEYYRQHR